MAIICSGPETREIILIVLLCAVMVMPVSSSVFFTSSAPGIITRGDPFTVSGTGEVNGTIAVWVVGRDHFEVLTTTPDHQGNFSITIKPSATDMFTSGQYGILFQDPGPDRTMEIEGGTDVNGSLAIMNKGKIIAHLGAREELGDNIHSISDQILSSVSLTGVDDTFMAEYFFVQKPALFFDRLIPASGFRLPDQVSGDQITISGTTNLGTDNPIDIEIRTRSTGEIITRKTVPVIAGSPMNTWKWDLEAPGLPPGDYTLTAASSRSNTTIEGSFAVESIASPSFSPAIPVVGGKVPPPPPDDYTFPILVACSLIVLAIVLYYAGRE